ncbi:MAG: TetR/AcrR family transcriptional regulator C-terminal domain-containing protein [Acidimicrobiales bacterium]
MASPADPPGSPGGAGTGAGAANRTSAAPGLPEVPWRMPYRTPQREPLTREAIVEAGLRVLDAVGMDGLSMRRVAEELGTGAASIYWHVRNKEEMLQLIFERVVSNLVLPEPDPPRWREQLKDLARAMRAQLNEHRDVARISLGRIPMGPAVVTYNEWLFQLLEPVGVPDTVIALLGDFFGLYVGAYAFEESLGTSSPTGEEMDPEQMAAMFRDYVRSLPEEQFPRTRAAADLLFGDDQDRYEFGIDLIVRGIESYSKEARRTS